MESLGATESGTGITVKVGRKEKNPKDLRVKPGIKKQAKANVKNRAELIEPSVDLFEKLGKGVKFSFTSVEDALPLLRKSSEKQLLKEL
ncbi:MAG: hypothetical protein JRN52_01320 [Nitrososphaerota archaeon]|nr:hypothetical protein [Nitrososphaerota archaeon]